MRHSLPFILPLLAISAFGFLASSALAGANNGNKWGFIMNEDGDKCYYDQTVIQKDLSFYKTIPAITGHIIFQKPKCMAVTDINKRLINIIISRWYSHPDANFQVSVNKLGKGGEVSETGTMHPIRDLFPDRHRSGLRGKRRENRRSNPRYVNWL